MNEVKTEERVEENVTMAALDPKTVEQLVEIGTNLVTAVTAKPTFKEKLKSRKFWIAIAGIIVGIGGLVGFGDSTTALIVFVTLQIVSILGYCIAEGYIDAARIKEMLAAIGVVGSVLGNDEAIKEAAQKALDEFNASVEDELSATNMLNDAENSVNYDDPEDDDRK